MTILDKLNYALNLNKTKRQQIITKALKSNDHKVIKKELTSKFKNTNSSRVKADIDFVNSYTKIVKGGSVNLIGKYKVALKNASDVNDISLILYKAINANVIGRININFTDKNGYTALMYNSLKCNKDFVEKLLKNGANPDIQDKFKKTALIYACIPEKNEDVVELLLEHNANPDIQDNSKRTALMHAVSRGHISYVKLLLEHNANPYITDEKNSIMNIALKKKYNNIVRLLKDYVEINNNNYSMSLSLLFKK